MPPDPLAAYAFGTGVIHLVAHVSLLSKLLKLPSCGFFPLIFLWGSEVTVFFFTRAHPSQNSYLFLCSFILAWRQNYSGPPE